ncbi:MAG: ATP-binding protein [Candidatus Omnitrophica bacterium]|nr:ATP-binding protein [Candidatus Omnitrophota bacterium]
MTTTPIQKIWNQLKFVSDYGSLTPEQIKTILPILDEEALAKDVKRISYLLQRSSIKRIKRFEDFDWKFNPKLPRNKIIGFSESPWITEVKNIVLIGPSGVGKSHLASALCYKAIQQGIPAAFVSCFDLVNKLKRSKNKHAMLSYYASIKVLCLDELGYVFPSQDEANDIFQIISKRSELTPTIVTTNLVPSQWGKIFEAATATAILDRLNLNGYFITCEGKSYRSRK